jgi:uncharacterized membrane-anchored protein YjiN (DUF445 family)
MSHPDTPPVPRIGTLGPRPTDELRRREIATMRRRATGLLVLAAVVFLAARWFEPSIPWLGFVRATAEASLVGGLADWFAVTALFRHPLGLPIPHTAIVRLQKDRIARILGDFVQHHFLTRDVVSARLRSLDLAHRAAAWLSDPAQAERLARQVAQGAARAVDAVPPEAVTTVLRDATVKGLDAVPAAPMVARVLELVAADGRHLALVDEAVKVVGAAVEANESLIREKIREESPRWVPGMVASVVSERVMGGIERFLAEVAQDPSHPVREKFDQAFRDMIERLRTSPETAAKAETIKAQLLGHPMADTAATAAWDTVRRVTARWEAAPETAPAALVRTFQQAGEQLLTNPGLKHDLNEFLVDTVAALVEQHRGEVAALIEHTVTQWDPDLAATRVELAVGRDLQYIRINGTLVGGLAGLGIYSFSRLFP